MFENTRKRYLLSQYFGPLRTKPASSFFLAASSSDNCCLRDFLGPAARCFLNSLSLCSAAKPPFLTHSSYSSASRGGRGPICGKGSAPPASMTFHLLSFSLFSLANLSTFLIASLCSSSTVFSLFFSFSSASRCSRMNFSWASFFRWISSWIAFCFASSIRLASSIFFCSSRANSLFCSAIAANSASFFFLASSSSLLFSSAAAFCRSLSSCIPFVLYL
mmetsp:Transcript_26130/g.37121  ORF Transcript_26130/g.37121 Transcript_26130/m.37121 type:complete len:219 (-) Transcript_26130:270-926(-)